MRVQNISTNYQSQNQRSSKQTAFGWSFRNGIECKPEEELAYLERLAGKAKDYADRTIKARKDGLAGPFSKQPLVWDATDDIYFANIGTPDERMIYLDGNVVYETRRSGNEVPQVRKYIDQIKETLGLPTKDKKTPPHYTAPFDGVMMKLSSDDLDELVKTRSIEQTA